MSKPFGKLATAKAALLVTGSTYVSFFFGLLVSAIIARGIGPADFGRYAYVVWLAGILVVVANNGLTSTGLRFISETLGKGANEAAKGIHGWLLRRQHVCVMISLGGFLVSLPLTIPPDWGMPLAVFIGVVAVSLIAKAYYIFDISAAKGHGQFAVEALSTTVLSGLNSGCGVGALCVESAGHRLSGSVCGCKYRLLRDGEQDVEGTPDRANPG